MGENSVSGIQHSKKYSITSSDWANHHRFLQASLVYILSVKQKLVPQTLLFQNTYGSQIKIILLSKKHDKKIFVPWVLVLNSNNSH